MKHIISLIMKYIIISIILIISLMVLTNASLGDVLYISLIVTIVSYVVGDLIILPLTNNTIATILDAGLSIVTILLFNSAVTRDNIFFGDALIASLLIGVGEWFFHKFLRVAVLQQSHK